MTQNTEHSDSLSKVIDKCNQMLLLLDKWEEADKKKNLVRRILTLV